MSTEWSTTTAKAHRRKKGATHQRAVAARAKALKEAKDAQLRAKRQRQQALKETLNGRSPPRSPQQPRLSNQQYRVLLHMQRASDFFDCDEYLLKRIILELNLVRVPQLEIKVIRLKILDMIVSEFQNKAGGKAAKRKLKNQIKSTNGRITPSSQDVTAPHTFNGYGNGPNGNGPNGHNGDGRGSGREEQRTGRPAGGRGEGRSIKSGKFRQFIAAVGNDFLDYVDVSTLCSLVRIEGFSFIPLKLNALHRWKAYTATKDIEHRLKQFNTALNVASSLKLYELKRAQSVETRECLNVVMANGLSLDHRFRGKNECEHTVLLDLAKKGMVAAAAKAVRGKCKELNVWSSNANFKDLSSAYLTEFADFQAAEQREKGLIGSKPPMSAMRRDDAGKRALRQLDRVVVDRRVIGRDNVQSVHCCYSKVHRAQLYEVHSYLWVFVELKTPKMEKSGSSKAPKRGRSRGGKEEKRQFMVWKGQCGVTKLE